MGQTLNDALLANGLPNGKFEDVDDVLKFRSRANGNDYDAKITCTGGGIAGYLGHGTFKYHAGLHSLLGYDGSEQFRASTQPNAVNYIEASGGIAGIAPSLFSGGTDTNVGMNLTMKGTGTASFNNGTGNLFNVKDPGALITSTASAYPGTATIPAGFDVPNNTAFALTQGRAPSFVVKASNVPISYVQVNPSNSTFPAIVAEGTGSNIQLCVQSKGTSLLALGNGNGFGIYVSSDASAANRVAIKAKATGLAATISPATDSETTLGSGLYLSCFSALQTIQSDRFVFKQTTCKQGATVLAATTGGSTTVAVDKSGITFNPAGTIAAYTVTLPAAPFDGQECEFCTTQTITAFTLNPNTGHTIASGAAPTTLTSSTPFAMRFISSISVWVRIR